MLLDFDNLVKSLLLGLLPQLGQQHSALHLALVVLFHLLVRQLGLGRLYPRVLAECLNRRLQVRFAVTVLLYHLVYLVVLLGIRKGIAESILK